MEKKQIYIIFRKILEIQNFTQQLTWGSFVMR